MKTIRRTCVLAAALSFAASSIPTFVVSPAQAAQSGTTGAPSAETTALRDEGIALHDRAVEGEDDAAARAVEHLERYLEHVSKDSEARAYLGGGYAMMARDASSVINKMRYANRGLRHLDRALEAAPGTFTVRLIRARVHSSLPKMFGRGDAALEDMLALDEIYRDAPAPWMAREMVAIYEALQSRAPDAGPWAARLDEARALAGGG